MRSELRCLEKAWWALAILSAVGCWAGSTEVRRPGWLGFGFSYHEEDPLSEKPSGFFVVQGIDQGGPAEIAGIEVQDVIFRIDGKPFSFETNLEMLDFLAAVKPGQEILLTVARAQVQEDLLLVASEMPNDKYERWRIIYEGVRQNPREL